MIAVVVFDLGGVVCAFRPERRLAELSRITGLAPADIDGRIWTSGLDHRAERGGLSEGDAIVAIRAIRAALDNRVGSEALRAAWAAAFEPDDEVAALVARVVARRVLFTNNGPVMSAVLGSELAAVAAQFDDIVCSWQIAATKPDPEAFDRLCARLECAPGDVLFVDDDRRNTDAAASCGIRSIHYSNAAELAPQLAALGVVGEHEVPRPGG
ncbi:MAG TPA: HAD-IA family hydrolase [Acidimicrobiia bacterium]